MEKLRILAKSATSPQMFRVSTLALENRKKQLSKPGEIQPHRDQYGSGLFQHTWERRPPQTPDPKPTDFSPPTIRRND
eukprot:scaffold1451_cov267-Pinguiococcus_pyrenoidosus.AAC.4